MAVENTPVDFNQPVMLNQAGTYDPAQANNDVTILGTPSNDVNILPSVSPGPETVETKNRRVLQAAMIQSANDGSSIFENYSAMLKNGLSGQSTLKQVSDKWNEDVKSAMFKQVDQNFANLGNPKEYVKSLNDVITHNDQLAARESAGQRASVDTSAVNAPYDLQESIRTRLQMIDIAEDIVKQTSILDTIGEVASGFIPGKLTLDNWQAMGFDLNPFKMAEDYRKLATKIQALPQDEALEQFNVLKEEWLDKLPPNRAAQMLLGLVDPSATEEVASSLGSGQILNLAFDMTVFYSTLAGLRKLYNPIRVASGLGDKTTAADININVQRGEQTWEEAVHIKGLIANTNAGPWKTSEVLPGVTEDISPAIHERLFQFRDMIKDSLGSLSDKDGFIREGMLNASDREIALRRINDEFTQWTEQALRGENKIIRLEGQKETHRGVEFSFEVTDAFGNISKGKTLMPFKREDIKFWQNLPQNTLSSIFGSEKWQAASSDYLDSVEAAIRLDTTTAAIGTQFRKLVKDATAPIRETKSAVGKSRKERLQDVDAVLIYGDQKQKVFSAKELRMGVNGIPLDDAQIETYWRLRTTFDALGVLRNQEEYARLSASGAKQINFGHDLFRFGEVKATAQEAADLLKNNKQVFSVWRHEGRDAGKAVEVREAIKNMDNLYAQGWRLVRLEDDVQRASGIYKHVLVYGDGVTDGAKTIDNLPPIVVDLKRGYVPRLNKEATWFVQAIRDGYVDGHLREGSRRQAVRSFDNEADAHAWAKTMYDGAIDAGFDSSTKFIVVKDGELEAFKAGDSQLGASRGLITGPRAKKAIPHGFPGEFDVDQMRVGAFEALELYLENTKNFISRNEWRMGMRTRWENTVKQKLGLDVKFEEPGAVLADKELGDLHSKIAEWSGFRDKSEKSFEEFVRKTYEFAMPIFGRNNFTRLLLNNRDADPLGRIRTWAFHSLLGTYNPAQLFVQANGAAVALASQFGRAGAALVKGNVGEAAANMGRIVTSFTKQQGLAMMQHAGAEVPETALKVVGKAHGFKNVQELKDMKTIWDRTGYYDSVLTSADVEAAARGYPVTASAFKRFFDNGLFFFRAGELFNRRFSFITAVDELGGATKVLGNEQLLKQAMTRANNLMLNLGRSNRAAFQKGFTSVPTQFLQIQTKTIETMLGLNKSLDASERLGLFLSQAMLYGPAGILGGHFATKYLLDTMGKDQIDVNNLPPETLAMINGGFTDYMLALFGVDGSFSDRAALFNGMDQTIVSLWTKDNTLAEWLLGPGGVPIKRVWQAWSLATPVAWSPKPVDRSVNATAQDITDALTFMATDVSEIMVSPFSTASQVARFMLMRDLGVIKDTQGNTIARPIGGYNPQTEWAALIGVKPNDLQRKFDLADMNKAYEDYIDLRVNMLLRNFDEYMATVNQHVSTQTPMEQETQRLFRKRWDIIVNSIEDEGLRDKVKQRWADRLDQRLTGDSQLDRQIQTFYRNMVTELVGAHTSTGTRLVQTRENDNGVQ
jgi:hypothetical protein